jgi:pimeloyl-ACP methyl ester carboxylesterase
MRLVVVSTSHQIDAPDSDSSTHGKTFMTKHTMRPLRIAAALTAVAIAAVGISACAAAGTTRSQATAAAHESPAPASLHMISHDGHDLAFYVTPGHLPAIVLDAGGGEDSSEWRKVAPALAKQTGSEVITYDRAGEGRSDEVPGPWTAQNAVADLKAGLTKLGVTHDVVLVSHSLAGEIATYFVRSDPRWIAGAVLVDADVPPFYTDSETAKIVAANEPQIAAVQGKPQSKATRQLVAEAANYGPVHHTYHQLTWPSSVPVTAIVSSQTPFDTPVDARLWKDAQATFVSAAPNRKLVAANSSHEVPTDRPDVVIKAVRDMTAQVH